MKKSKHYFTAAVFSAIFSISGSVYAAPIPVFNTGVDSTGAVLSTGSADPHYSLVTVPGGTTETRAISSASGYPIPPYTGDNATSRWIGPNSDSQLNGPAGDYKYETSFNLTGLDSSSASITGTWATDNNGVDILLNGISLGLTTPFTSFTGPSSPFTINSGFLSGNNILDFVVHNGGGPTALRVEFDKEHSSAQESQQSPGVSDVPVPAAFWLFGSVFASLMGMRRKATTA